MYYDFEQIIEEIGNLSEEGATRLEDIINKEESKMDKYIAIGQFFNAMFPLDFICDSCGKNLHIDEVAGEIDNGVGFCKECNEITAEAASEERAIDQSEINKWQGG